MIMTLMNKLCKPACIFQTHFKRHNTIMWNRFHTSPLLQLHMNQNKIAAHAIHHTNVTHKTVEQNSQHTKVNQIDPDRFPDVSLSNRNKMWQR